MRMPSLTSLRTEGVALLRWWIRELRDIGQQLLERTAPRLAKQVVIEFNGNTAEAYTLRRGSASESATIFREPNGTWSELFPPGEALAGHHGARATLVLAPEDTFSFDLFVPQALRRDLDKVITLHLERELPLARDQFGVDYRIREHLSSTGTIRVQVLVAHRTQLEELRDLAQKWGLRATRIGAPAEGGLIVGDFLRGRFRFGTMTLSPPERRLSAVVSALACTLGALVLGQWTYERIAVHAQLRRVNSQAQLASRLADRLTRESAPARDLLNIERVPDASDALAALTQAVPSYAWVYQLRIEAPSTGAVVIHMEAFAPPSTSLLSDLEDTHRFGTVQLVSATSGVGPSGLDRLKLSASRPAASPVPSEEDEMRDTSVGQ
jgi:hypothetical protein